MQVGDTTITTTPYEDSSQRDVDWRHRIGRYWADHPDWVPLDSQIQDDYHINMYREFLTLSHTSQCAGMSQDSAFRPYYQAWRWNGASEDDTHALRFYLEPLLLSSASMQAISLDLSDADDQKAHAVYEQLFFNVRNDDFSTSKSCYRRTRASMEGIDRLDVASPLTSYWRFLGGHLGYPALALAWCWPDAHGLQEPLRGLQTFQDTWLLAQARQLENCARGTVANEDIVALLSVVSSHERMQRETGGGTSEEMKEGLQAFAAAMSLTAPTIVVAAKEVDTQAEKTVTIQQRLRAQRQISSTTVQEDNPEAGKSALNTLMREISDNKQ
jgi:hypothetical protein